MGDFGPPFYFIGVNMLTYFVLLTALWSGGLTYKLMQANKRIETIEKKTARLR